jgi:hypothetical protein
MLSNLFNWIRTQVKQAVLAGVGDALEELEGTATSDTAPAVLHLRTRLTPALSNGTPSSVPAMASGVPVDESAAPTADSPSTHRNGRRTKATA